AKVISFRERARERERES
ncbi:hypothetical protein EE612_040779, partial [Oryza sativa]